MKKLTVFKGSRLFTDVVDGPGWTDVDVDGYYDSKGTDVPSKVKSQNLKVLPHE